MIKFDNGGRLVQSLKELPRLTGAKRLYMDFETTSFDPKQKALKPYHGHRIAGIGVTADDKKGAWYIPIRCTHEQWNLPLKPVLKWLNDTINSCEEWVNHGVKFDAHFARQDGIDFNCRLVDTNTLAKVIQSDRFSYELDTLSSEWLEDDISGHKSRVDTYLAGCKSKNYGDTPADILGEYGCQDVLTNRILDKYLRRRKSEQVSRVWETEILLTPVLFDMEVEGLHVDPTELLKQQLLILNELLILEEELHKLTDISIRPHTNADCYEVLCNKYGLPVLGRTKKKEPSFDKDTLVSYRAYPLVQQNPELTTIVTKIQRYRKLHTLHNFFVAPYIEHQVDGVMHPDYNQIVRTGRMSCRRPNSQQLSYEAKLLVHPAPGCDLVRWDYSQIEFRLIVHYLKNVAAIAAYHNDPNTDFHQWVANMSGIPRRPAKNVNFCVAFGGGKNKVVMMLAANMELVGNLSTKVDELVTAGKIDDSQRQQVFELLCHKRGEQVYQEYHDTLPTLKPTTRRAARNLERRGYVFNAYGRRRHLPVVASYRAFNTIIQSCAADIMKERTVAVAPRYNSDVRALGVRLNASVHDETLANIPKEVSADKRVLKNLSKIFESTTIEFRVPILVSCGKSEKNWAHASSDEGEVNFD
jgi:DNA polymerase-1